MKRPTLVEHKFENSRVRWQAKRLSPVHATPIAIDREPRPRSRDPDRVSAISGQRGRWLGAIRAVVRFSGR
jgi:hypothetical protein